MHILNVVVRVLILLVGIAVIIPVPPFANSGIDPLVRVVFGVVVMLYGAYRLASYLRARRIVDED